MNNSQYFGIILQNSVRHFGYRKPQCIMVIGRAILPPFFIYMSTTPPLFITGDYDFVKIQIVKWNRDICLGSSEKLTKGEHQMTKVFLISCSLGCIDHFFLPWSTISVPQFLSTLHSHTCTTILNSGLRLPADVDTSIHFHLKYIGLQILSFLNVK